MWFNNNIDTHTVMRKMLEEEKGNNRQISIWQERQELSEEQSQMKIQTHVVLHACLCIVDIPALRRTVSVTAAHP